MSETKPVEGASIAEALEALEVLRYFVNAPPAGVLPQVKAWKATDTVRSALERAAAEWEAHRWIPCSERMPEPLERVLVAYMTQFGPSVVTGYWDGDQWCILMKTGVATGNGVTDSTVAWQPLPAPPKGSAGIRGHEGAEVRAAILLRLAELARIERALTATGQAWARCRWIRVERLELKERLLVMAELHVFHDGHDWFIAANIADALALRVETYSAEGTEAFDELYQMPDSAPIGVLCDEHGKPDDHGIGVTKTAAEWAAQEGRGVLCSRDF